MLQFLCRFALLSTFLFETGHRKQREFGKLRVTLPVKMAPFSKEIKIFIKNLYECKGYNARQLQSFRIKVGRRTAAGEVEKVQSLRVF